MKIYDDEFLGKNLYVTPKNIFMSLWFGCSFILYTGEPNENGPSNFFSN